MSKPRECSSRSSSSGWPRQGAGKVELLASPAREVPGHRRVADGRADRLKDGATLRQCFPTAQSKAGSEQREVLVGVEEVHQPRLLWGSSRPALTGAPPPHHDEEGRHRCSTWSCCPIRSHPRFRWFLRDRPRGSLLTGRTCHQKDREIPTAAMSPGQSPSSITCTSSRSTLWRRLVLCDSSPL